MTLESEVRALRSSVGLSRPSHMTLVRVDGPDALELLQSASTQSPYMREGRVRHTLLLREDASVLADVFIVKVDDGFLVVAEGPTEQELVTWLEASPMRKQATVRGVGSEWTAFGIDGPYAWELMSGLLGPAALGLPYLALLRREELMCLRAGKTGEYGYLVLVPSSAATDFEAKLLEVGRPLDLARVGLEALDVCALESWHFSMRTLPKDRVLTPIELQLQWRVVYSREFVGAAALRARRAEGAKARVTCFTTDQPVLAGQSLTLDDAPAGEVIAAMPSPTLGLTIGIALLELRLAHPHITFTAPAGPIQTRTAFLVDNLSLRIDPHKHSYATRDA